MFINGIDLRNKNVVVVCIKEKHRDGLKSVVIDLEQKIIYDPNDVISELKFGEWMMYISIEQQKEYLKRIKETFTEQEIEEKIIKPLMKSEE